MSSDPVFYAAAAAAVFLFGFAKGGFGGGLGIVAVPLLAAVTTPAHAVAILLPLLWLMDAMGICVYRREWQPKVVAVMLPGALAGVAAGGLAFGYLPEWTVRLVVGLVAILFAADHFRRRSGLVEAKQHRPAAGAFWGSVAGFTSTIAHAGGPPANVYMLPLRMAKRTFVGSTIILFAAVNAAKAIPYTALGLFDRESLLVSSLLIPVAALGMVTGIRAQGLVSEKLFYTLCHGLVMVTGIKLVFDALTSAV